MTIINMTRTFSVTVGPIGGEDDYDVEVLMEIAIEDGEAYFLGGFAHNDQVERHTQLCHKRHTQLWHKCEEWVDDNQDEILDEARIDVWCAKGAAVIERRV